ncbi:hypothetical protein [Bosea psychrotolerans]|uniref:Uncharacterized protein n=1 Tax=Bosea psychrotolerans TaxID=1871628 RepID=A0A2S4MBL3_9HYPH|nr:hypothetical protein [Bosea psychrotolerans]POR51887.1 hypothetical protein CYD53_106170 [Bosea psychrotolerans]
MKLGEFQDAIDRHGDDLATWPAGLRQPGLALLLASPAARRILDEARSLRSAFKSASPVRAPKSLIDRIIVAAVGADSQPPAAATQSNRQPGAPINAKTASFI